ncbi:MAG: patatin-like phospholipase family protein [Bacteroidota bacterium]|nr:patatin-like phospholipase family protein [Bacteroidota bacterium]
MLKKVGIVFSGGGIRGVAHLGVIKALLQYDIKIHSMSGTSAGAMVAAFVSAGYLPDEIKDIIKTNSFFGYKHLLWGKAGLFDMGLFDEAFKKYFPHNKIEQLPIPVFIATTDIVNGKSYLIDKGDLSIALQASSCVPLVFQPINYMGKTLVDGAITNNLPIEPLLNTCDAIVGIHVNSMSKNVDEIHMKDMLDRSFHLALAQSVYAKSHQCKLFIEPPNMSRFGMFDMDKIDEIFENAYKYTLSMESEIKKFIAQIQNDETT